MSKTVDKIAIFGDQEIVCEMGSNLEMKFFTFCNNGLAD